MIEVFTIKIGRGGDKNFTTWYFDTIKNTIVSKYRAHGVLEKIPSIYNPEYYEKRYGIIHFIKFEE